MARITSLLVAASLTVFAVTTAAAAERQAKPLPGAKVAQTAPVKAKARKAIPDYQNVAGWKARVDDPFYAYAAEPAPRRMAPVITNFPMPNTVWW